MRISFFEIPAQTTIEYFTITTKYASFSRYAFLSYYLTGLKLHTTKKILSKNAPSGVCSGRLMGGGGGGAPGAHPLRTKISLIS